MHVYTQTLMVTRDKPDGTPLKGVSPSLSVGSSCEILHSDAHRLGRQMILLGSSFTRPLKENPV